MKRLFASLIAALPLFASAAVAQSVEDCDWRASAAAIAEPWEANSRTFSNGAVRLALLDTVEPAAGAFHLLILSPPYSELGDRQCKVVSLEGNMGFASLAFDALEAGYDPAVGLQFNLPMSIFVDDGGEPQPGLMHVTLNQATGDIGAGFQFFD